MHPLLEGLLGLVAPPRCVGCDQRSDSRFCEICDSLLEPSASPAAVYHFGGPIADAIHRYKYQGRSELSVALGVIMAESAGRWFGRVDAVVPVPLHWRRRRSRGYDQASLLAGPIAKALRVPALYRGLRRVRHTPSQVDLPHRLRVQNVAGAFEPAHLRGAGRVLLIDDVRTTGATLGAASEALREGGAREVHTLVLATRLLARGT